MGRATFRWQEGNYLVITASTFGDDCKLEVRRVFNDSVEEVQIEVWLDRADRKKKRYHHASIGLTPAQAERLIAALRTLQSTTLYSTIEDD